MFDRFSEPARRVVFYGRYHASETCSLTIDARHLVLGLLHVAPDLAPIPDADSLKTKLRATFAPAAMTSTADIPLTPSAMRALQDAARVCKKYGIETIEPIHLLWGLVRNVEGEAAVILAEEGITADRVEASIADHS